MLIELRLENYAVIDNVAVEFDVRSQSTEGDIKVARMLATRAKDRFPLGSPGWVKADDISNRGDRKGTVNPTVVVHPKDPP